MATLKYKGKEDTRNGPVGAKDMPALGTDTDALQSRVNGRVNRTSLVSLAGGAVLEDQSRPVSGTNPGVVVMEFDTEATPIEQTSDHEFLPPSSAYLDGNLDIPSVSGSSDSENRGVTHNLLSPPKRDNNQEHSVHRKTKQKNTQIRKNSTKNNRPSNTSTRENYGKLRKRSLSSENSDSNSSSGSLDGGGRRGQKKRHKNTIGAPGHRPPQDNVNNRTRETYTDNSGSSSETFSRRGASSGRVRENTGATDRLLSSSPPVPHSPQYRGSNPASRLQSTSSRLSGILSSDPSAISTDQAILSRGGGAGAESNQNLPIMEPDPMAAFAPMSVFEGEWGEPCDLDSFCFCCENGDSDDTGEPNPHMDRLLRMFDNPMNLSQIRLARNVQKMYDTVFRPHAEVDQPWTLLSIRKHMRERGSLSSSAQLRTLCNMHFRLMCELGETGLLVKNSDTNSVHLNNKGASVLKGLVKDYLAIKAHMGGD